MRVPRLSGAIALALIAFTLLGCESTEDIADFPESVGVETRQFVVALRGAGATVEIVETAPPSQGLFAAPSTHLRVNGADVFVFEFTSAAEVDAAMARIPAILPVTLFPGAPHFYRGNRIIVLYAGTDPAMLSLLQGLLGAPVTG
jgi:hypothetical protein